MRHKLRGDSEEELEGYSEGAIVPAERIIQQAGFKVGHTLSGLVSSPRGGGGAERLIRAPQRSEIAVIPEGNRSGRR